MQAMHPMLATIPMYSLSEMSSTLLLTLRSRDLELVWVNEYLLLALRLCEVEEVLLLGAPLADLFWIGDVDIEP